MVKDASNHLTMFINFFKVAIRNLFRQKVYSFINILGLAISMTACLLIVLYVKHELSYDSFFPNADRIHKLGLERRYPNYVTFYAAVPHSFAQAMQNDFPEVENTLLIFGPNKNAVLTTQTSDKEIKSFEEDYFLFADSSFFSFFDIKLIKGDKKTSMATPGQVLISEAIAKKYFGAEEPLGKTIRGDFGELKVAGVFEALPDNTHLRFDFLGSISGAPFLKVENYTGFDSQTYIKLKAGTDAKKLEAKFPKMVDTYASAQIERELGKSWEDYKKSGNGYRYFLQPLTSIHLDPTNLEFTITPSGNLKYIYILSFIAILILVIACINFMNLATARSAERAREVGVRKVMGSFRSQLIAQFLAEAILLSLIATVVALTIAQLFLPMFNTLVEKQLQFDFSTDIFLGIIGFALLIGIFAGIYPAFVLSNYSPVVVMKGNFTSSAKGAWHRNGLVIFQFMISIILIVGTIVVGRQMHFMQTKSLGFDKEQVLMVQRAFALDKKSRTFIDEIERYPEVSAAASTSTLVGNRDDVFGQQFQPEGSDEVLTVKSMVMDDDFGQMIGFELKEGKFFSKETNDSLNILVNETAAKTMGFNDPIGRKLSNMDLFRAFGRPDSLNVPRNFTIIGVVKDFHFQSLRDGITPLVIFNYEILGIGANNNYIAVRLKPTMAKEAIAKIENLWKELVPDQPFRYEFLDENLGRGYAEEQRSGKLFAVFSGLAIIIACVGLFGLSAYTASLRTKEIGIRKVVGASVSSVVVLLSKDFTRLVFIAFLLATPLAWWMMDTWLKGFAFRVDLGVAAFVTAGIIAISIALLTVSYQSIKAAIVNPVKSLKSE